MDSVIAIIAIFIGLPWLIMHHVTKWKTSNSLTDTDENLLDDMYDLAKRLTDRVETMERIIRLDNPDWKPSEPRNLEDRGTDLDFGSSRFDRMSDKMTDRRN
jgi:phage shock protein B